jgi:hypothetical protein
MKSLGKKDSDPYSVPFGFPPNPSRFHEQK